MKKQSTQKYQTSTDRGCGNEYELVPNYKALRDGDKRNTHHTVPAQSRLT